MKRFIAIAIAIAAIGCQEEECSAPVVCDDEGEWCGECWQECPWVYTPSMFGDTTVAPTTCAEDRSSCRDERASIPLEWSWNADEQCWDGPIAWYWEEDTTTGAARCVQCFAGTAVGNLCPDH